MLEELGVDYTLEKYNRDPNTNLAPAAYKAVSPLGTAPVITDGDVTLSETNAILDYILEYFSDDSFNPALGSKGRARHLFWYHAAQGSMMPILMFDSLMRIAVKRMPKPIGMMIKPVFRKMKEGFSQPRMQALLEKAEADLSLDPWFGGEQLSSADIAMSYPMESAKARGFMTASYPNCIDWLNRIYKRPAFREAKAKDGRECMVLPL